MGSLLSAIAGPIVGNLVGGLFGSHAAAPAAQAQSSAAGAESSLLNTIINAYNQTYAPAQQQAMGQYTGLVGNLPIQNIAESQIAQDLMPTFMPGVIQAQGQTQIQNQTEQAIAQMRQQLAQRGITGPAAEQLINQLNMTGLQNQAQYASNVGAWEADQTLANRRNAFTDVMNILGTTMGAANAGNALVGAGLTGSQNLANMYGQAAGQAAAPYQRMGQQIGSAVQSYYSTPGQGGSTPYPPVPSTSTGYSPWGTDASQPQPGYNLPALPQTTDTGNIYAPSSAPNFWTGNTQF